MAARCPLLMLLVCFCCCLVGLLLPTAQASSLAQSVEPFYHVQEKFLDSIQPPHQSLLLQYFAPLFLGANYGNLWDQYLKNYWRTYPGRMIGFTVLIAIGLFLIIVVPLVGCCVCCCRCCCSKCGGRLNYMEKKGAACRRGFYGFSLLLLATLLLFGAVLAFVSNQLLRDQLSSGSSGGGGGRALNDFSTACSDVADTLRQVSTRGREATFAAVSAATAALLPSANRTLARLQADLSYGNATNAMASIRATKAVLWDLYAAHNTSATYATGHSGCVEQLASFNSTMADTRNNLTQPAPFACPSGAAQADCDLVNASLANMLLEINADNFGYEAVNEMSGRLAGVANVTEMQLLLTEATAALDNITEAGMSMVKASLSKAEASLNGSQLMEFWSRLDTYLEVATKDMKRLTNLSAISLTNPITRAANQSVADLVSHFDSYRYYGYIVLASFFLLLILLFYLGLLYGCAGEPPYEDAGCCNRGVGANCLLAAAALAWLLFALLMLLTMMGFISGGLVDTETCRHLTGRTGTAGYSMLDDLVTPLYDRINSLELNVTVIATKKPVTALLGGCQIRNNGSLAGSLVDVAGLSWALKLAPLVEGFLNNTRRELARRGSELLAVSGGAFNASQLVEARELARNASAVNFTAYISELSRNLSVADLTPVLAAMSRIASDTNDTAAAARFRELNNTLSRSWALAATSVNQQRAELERLTQSLNQLNTSLADLPERLASTGAALRSPDVLLAALQSASAGLAEEIVTLAEAQLLPRLLDDSLSCSDLSVGLNRALAVPCVSLLRPFIGYWAGLGICLLALLPCLVLAIKLANLYRKTQKYLADMDDGNPKPV